MKQAVLLVNLGSPDSTQIKDIKKYLDEFLMDKFVIDMPFLLRALIVRGIILNTRPKKSAEAYSRIWQKEGSPLVIISEKVKKKLQEKVSIPVELGMRYGSMSIHSGIKKLVDNNPDLEKLFLIPLYPHYAMSSYQTVVEKTNEVVKKYFPKINVLVQKPFYNEENYISVLAESIKPYLKDNFDHFLFSYHGIPIRHLRKSDITNSHCYRKQNCCSVKSEAHAFCYKHQVTETTFLVAKKLGLKEGKFSMTFQSRLKGDTWLKPYTDFAFKEFPQKGIKRLAVICPAFVSDCLETLEEISIAGKESFMENGGEYFKQIECLNDKDIWIDVIKGYVENNLSV